MRSLLAVLMTALIPTVATAQAPTTITLEPASADTIVVVGSPEQLGSLIGESVRPVAVQTREQLRSRPLRSVADALSLEPSVISSQRQAYGAQSDLSVRGSSFDQVQLLLDGFDLSDPQTGHHLLNLPLAMHDLERIEVMPGHGSVLYGSGAFGGTVNVVPRLPADHPGGSLGILAGPDGTWAVRGDGNLVAASRGVRVSAERFRTDGHDVDGQWSGRDADHTVLTLRAMETGDDQRTDVFLGLAHREFGAMDFYTPTMAHEVTSSLVTTLRHRRHLGATTLEARVAGRRHRDEFTLFRDDPQRYRNDHLTRRFLGGLRATTPVTGAWSLAADLEAAYEDIDSDGIRGGDETEALGEHVRRRASLGLELSRDRGPLRLQLGTRLDTRGSSSPRLGASAAAAYRLNRNVTLQASAGSVFRVPTFTDLYYSDPYSQGDPDLEAESGWAWDAGATHDDGRWLVRATYFERHEDQLIAWARAAGDTVWNVMNVADGLVRGLELQAGVRHDQGHRLMLGWQNLHQERDFAPGTESRYGLIIPRQHLTGTVSAVLPWHLEGSLTGRYLHRTGGNDDFRVAAVFSARLGWRHGPWSLDLDVHNLLDRRHEDVPGAVMPGRSVMVGTTMMY